VSLFDLDHVTLAGARLEDMREAFTAATGVPTEYGGLHSNHATEMALASFPDGSYIELIGIQPQADPAALAAHPWSEFLRCNAGPCAFALSVTDLNGEVRRLTAAGIRAGGSQKAGRTRPDGVSIAWETAEVGPGHLGSFFPFLIHDSTPREHRVYPSGRPTSTRCGGIGLVVIGVRDLDESIATYRKAFPVAAPLRQRDKSFGADTAWFEGTALMLAQGLEPDSWLARRTAFFGESPCAFALADLQ
jgi:hypothetical protein